MITNRANHATTAVRSHLAGVLDALEWWSAGLAAALAWSAQVGRPQRRFQLRGGDAPFILRRVNGRHAGTLIDLPGDPAQAVPTEVLRETRGSVIEVVVPPAAMLERHLDPLPAESRPYVETVVQHQIERLFPWRAADVLRKVDVRTRDDGNLDVSVRATLRPHLAPALAQAAACGAREVVVLADNGAHAADAGIGVPIGRTGDGPVRTARGAVAALLVLAVAVLGWPAYWHWSLSAELATLDERIAAERAALRRWLASDDQSGDGLEARKRNAVIAVAAIEALSAILPDDTYLTELALDAGRLRIGGVSARATEIVPLLEGSGKFKSASFYAPTTRLSGADRFSIEAVVVPQAQALR